MGDLIIIVIVALGLISGVRAIIKHTKGQGGGCCGGGTVPKAARKSLNGKKVGEKIVAIQGMQCENCKNSVEKQINMIEGAAAKVNLNKNTAVVSLDRLVSDDELTAAVEKAGFQVTKIEFKEA